MGDSLGFPKSVGCFKSWHPFFECCLGVNEMDMFELAAKSALRVKVGTRTLTVEDLYRLPLIQSMGRGLTVEDNLRVRAEVLAEDTEKVLDLERVAQTVNAAIRSAEGVGTSFVGLETANPELTSLKLAFDIIKRIIEVRQGEALKIANAKEVARKRKRLQELLAAKRDEKDASQSIDELEKQLAELEG